MRALAAGLVVFASGCFLPDVGVGSCDLQTGTACRPGFFCGTDGGCSQVQCTAGSTQACALANQDYGEHVCGDAGWSKCAATPATKCSNQLGVCASAARRFDDTPGCTALSYGRNDSGYQLAETCPGDTRDNDCDGYVDEAGNTDGEIVCGLGPVCQARTDGGRFATYRRCGAATCPPSQLMAELPQWRPLDLCDGLDRDCSGIADLGAATTLVEGASEVAAIRDDAPGVFLLAAARPLPDAGGHGLYIFRVDDRLSPVGGSDWIGERTGSSLFAPCFTAGLTTTAAIAWRDGPGTVAMGVVLAGNAERTKVQMSPPETIVSGPSLATFDGKVMAAAIVVTDAGTRFASIHQTGLPLAGGPEDWSNVPDAGHDLALAQIALWGDGTDRGFASGATTNYVTAAVLARDGGGMPLVNGVFADVPVDARPEEPAFIAVSGVGGRRALAMVGSKTRALYFLTHPGEDGGTHEAPLVQLPWDAQAGALAAGVRSDGGFSALFAVRTNSDLVVFDDVDGGRVVSTNATGQPAVAWSPQSRDHVLVANAVSRPDGGTAVVGRMVCLPR